MRYPKPKKPSRKKLIRQLDEIVSKIIRKKYRACVVCGSTRNITAGHLFSRAHYSTRWDFDNVFPQCLSDNLKHEYDPFPFYNWHVGFFGKKKTDEVYAKWKKISKFKDYELQAMYEKLLQVFNDL